MKPLKYNLYIQHWIGNVFFTHTPPPHTHTHKNIKKGISWHLPHSQFKHFECCNCGDWVLDFSVSAVRSQDLIFLNTTPSCSPPPGVDNLCKLMWSANKSVQHFSILIVFLFIFRLYSDPRIRNSMGCSLPCCWWSTDEKMISDLECSFSSSSMPILLHLVLIQRKFISAISKIFTV